MDSLNRHAERPHEVNLNLRDLSQLFNSMDPSPFIAKDLDDNAEEFIVSWAEEYPPHDPLKLVIYLEREPKNDPGPLVRQAVHNHFIHRAELTELEFKHLMKQGLRSLIVGLLFLIPCLAISELLSQGEGGTWAAVTRESLTIAGWVAMWRPMQIYLYDWWPLRSRTRLYEKLSDIPVEIVAVMPLLQGASTENTRMAGAEHSPEPAVLEHREIP